MVITITTTITVNDDDVKRFSDNEIEMWVEHGLSFIDAPFEMTNIEVERDKTV